MPDPLEGDHALLMRAALPICDRYGLVLAGGYAIRAHGLVSRPSDDLDFATASAAPVEEIAAALAHAYRQSGLQARVVSAEGRKGHLTVALPTGAAYRIDILKEPLNHPAALMSFGPVLSLEDAVALKVGALHDRGLPRDVIDVHGATAYFSNAELVTLGRKALDEDFYLEDLRDQLDHAAAYSDEEFEAYGCRAEQIVVLKSWAQEWADQIGRELAEMDSWTGETEEPVD
ncbi:nucleotidyl transferase AbiEii/AbiGii toxin family protein [Planomonospora sp. ID82291]|uniref:nucleotidyl transferase AbiEii/AbiGii toxin family protein n=1 Tax=Planomonospora sp. ID82291 TaxID=2738136 RepID=UPI0018C3A05D|nr:nucleotidyl transferase AbiEii/AbiGii toxin family protein [Planomonospora sp. ID82291]MBG0818565.1 nucleotidyl transferase AbiEii/AbiGii toxin family protein [Planomonospora sp. ID82291]